MRDTSKPANGNRTGQVQLYSASTVSGNFFFQIYVQQPYTIRTWAEDTATLGSDRSADPGAGIAGRR